MIKYEARITAIGELVSEFLAENILVLFNQQAPEELAEFSVLHDGTTLHAPVEPGDKVVIGESTVTVLAVGEVANANLANLGHLVLKCNGEHEAEMPGDVCATKDPLPELFVGMRLLITDDA